MKPINKVLALKKIAADCALRGYSFLLNFTDEQLSEQYNGIGPEWFPAVLREIVDTVTSEFQAAALIHDVRWSNSDGSRSFFDESNEELGENCATLAKYFCSWYNPRRYILLRRAKTFKRLCSLFGWSAYTDAYKKGKK